MDNNKERFFGVGEPLIQRENDQGICAEIPIKIAGDPQNTNCGKCGLQANLALC